MNTIQQSEEFREWFKGLKDQTAKARILLRIKRLAQSNRGDAKHFDGISEPRIDTGPGYRVYVAKRGNTVYLLLCGGYKSSPRKDHRESEEDAGGKYVVRLAATSQVVPEKECVMSTKFSAFDVAGYLDSEAAMAAYLNETMAENDSDLFLSALADIARARSMSKVAEDSGLGRESLCKALRPGAKPGFATITRFMGALGVRVIAKPIKIKAKAKIAVPVKTSKVAPKVRRARVRKSA